MTEITFDPEAPTVLVDTTRRLREALMSGHDGLGDPSVDGWCVETSMILARTLSDAGYPAIMRSVSARGDRHWVVYCDDWILDTTAGQYGADPVIVFRSGSPADWYGPGYGDSNYEDEDIIDRFARWGPTSGSAVALLTFAGLERLAEPIKAQIEALRRERLQMIDDY